MKNGALRCFTYDIHTNGSYHAEFIPGIFYVYRPRQILTKSGEIQVDQKNFFHLWSILQNIILQSDPPINNILIDRPIYNHQNVQCGPYINPIIANLYQPFPWHLKQKLKEVNLANMHHQEYLG